MTLKCSAEVLSIVPEFKKVASDMPYGKKYVLLVSSFRLDL